MVDVLPDIVQVVMLPTGPDTLLGVDGSFPLAHVAVGVDGTHKDRLELVHTYQCSLYVRVRSSFGLTSVGEEQSGVVQRYGGGGVDIQIVVLLHEEVQEGLPDLLGCLGFVHPGLFSVGSL